MMKDIFLSVFEISVSASLVILVMLVLSPYLNKRYAAKWKYLIWLALALRLAVPFHLSLPDRALVINVPEQVITPITVDAENAVPIVLNTEAAPAKVTVLDIIAYLWGMGVVLCLAVHLLCYGHYKRKLMQNAFPVEEDRVLRQMCRLSGELCIKPEIQVVRASQAGSPMMIGFLKPVLVLPNDDCSEEELFFILKHELIHYKHHDIYFKLLLVVANAIHWFNPMVYIMQKEAVVDMELYCDESVIRLSGMTERKAYTETLFSTMSRQYKKGSALTTHFYGGKRIMKKRFQNILRKSNKRNGRLVCVCVICLTLMSGAMVGCSAVAGLPEEVQAHTGMTDMTQTENGDTQAPNGDVQTVLPVSDSDTLYDPPKADGGDSQTSPTQEQDTDDVGAQTPSTQEQDTQGDSGENLSADALEIKNLVEELFAAYYGGDIDTLQRLLPENYDWGIDVYDGTCTVSDIKLKGLPEDEQPEGTVVAVSVEHRNSDFDDNMLVYLTVELIKQNGRWEVQFYGLEG